MTGWTAGGALTTHIWKGTVRCKLICTVRAKQEGGKYENNFRKEAGNDSDLYRAGAVIPVTVVEAGPVTVTQIKTVEN